MPYILLAVNRKSVVLHQDRFRVPVDDFPCSHLLIFSSDKNEMLSFDALQGKRSSQRSSTVAQWADIDSIFSFHGTKQLQYSRHVYSRQ